MLQRSVNNELLYEHIKINGYSRAICNKPFIASLYENVDFQKENITEIDSEAKKFEKMKFLNLNNNYIEKLENLPTNLKELTLYYNLTRSLAEKQYHENLLFLGLGYNILTDEAIGLLKNLITYKIFLY